MFRFFCRVLIEFPLYPIAGDSHGRDRVHGVSQNTNNFRCENGLKDINRLPDIALIGGSNRALIDTLAGTGSEFLDVCKEGFFGS